MYVPMSLGVKVVFGTNANILVTGCLGGGNLPFEGVLIHPMGARKSFWLLFSKQLHLALECETQDICSLLLLILDIIKNLGSNQEEDGVC